MANQDLNPTGDVQGSSYLYQYGTTPNTRTPFCHEANFTPLVGLDITQFSSVISTNTGIYLLTATTLL